MLKTLRELFDSLVPGPAEAVPPQTEEHRLQLATAVMLVEVMRADTHFHHDERLAVLAALRDKFGLADDEAARLTELAESEAKNATDLFAFTSHIDACFEMPAKLRMLEHMWRVALADGRIDAHERHLMWRIADLLHVPQGAAVHARLRAQQQAGGEPGAVGRASAG